MLKEIILSNFGRFRDRSFTLAPTTVFYGPNEAGKTTIFDAIFHALCRPSGNRRSGKLLRERYGADAESRLLFTGAEVLVDDEEYRNLHAIRAGDVAASLPAGDSRWIEKVRASLFAGGLDPRELADKLRQRTETHAGRVHNKERRALTEELEKVRARIKDLQDRRARILSGDTRLAELRARVKNTGERLNKARVFLKEHEAEVAQQEAARDRLSQEALLSDLELIQELSQRLQKMEELPRGDVNEFDRLEAARVQIKNRLSELENAISRRRERLVELSEREGEYSARSARQKEKRDRALLDLDRLREFRERSAFKTETRWNAPLLGLAAACFAGGVACLVFAGSIGPYLALGAAFAGGAASLFARRTFSVPDREALAEFTARLQAGWETLFPDETGWPAESPESAEGYLASFEPAYRAHLGESDRLRTELAEARALQEKENHERIENEMELTRAGEVCDAYLKKRGVNDRDELLLRQNEITGVRAQLGGLREKVERRHPNADHQNLRREIRRKLESYDEAGVPRQYVPEETLRSLRARREETRRKIAVLESEEHTAQLETERLASEMRGSTLGLPEEIVELESLAAAQTARLDELDLDQTAAGVAANLFDELAADTELALGELTRDLAQLYTEMAVAGGGLHLETLELKNVLLEDGGGNLRPLEHCSTGTRDTFLLAARLVLARRTAPDVRLLVLDEPFLSLDAERQRGVLEFLSAFQVAHDYQFLFFTKEPALREAVTAVFSEVVVHEPGKSTESAGKAPKPRTGAKQKDRSTARTVAPADAVVQGGLFGEG